MRNIDYSPLHRFADTVVDVGEADETHNWYSIPKEKWYAKYHEYGTLVKEGYVVTRRV